MRYFVYRRYIKVFRYIRNHDNDKISEVEGKFGKRGEEALSILESRGGIINKFTFWDKSNCVIYNMGTNKGYSVKEVVETYEKTNGIKLNYKYGNRRKGDATMIV